MPIEVSFDGSEQAFEPIPKGSYDAHVHSIVPKKTQNDEDMLNVRFVIASGQFQGRSLFGNFVLRDDLKWKLQNLLIATGVVQPRTKSSFVLSDNGAELIGKKLGLKVGEGEFNGELRAEVRSFFATSGVATPAATVTPGGVPPPPAPATRRL